MNLLRFILHPSSLIPAANDSGEIAAANALGGEAIFDVQQGDRLFVPYGRYQHPKGLQIFDKESAEAMIRAFNSVGAKIGRFLTGAGAPVYAGHPDVPGRADSNPAAPALGWIEGITAENDGASFAVKWNADGEHAVSNAHFRFYSAHWNCRPVKGGIQPVQLLSIGLTNNPRIPVPAIANDSGEGRWITVNGRAVLIRDGESVEEALGKKDKAGDKPDDDNADSSDSASKSAERASAEAGNDPKKHQAAGAAHLAAAKAHDREWERAAARKDDAEAERHKKASEHHMNAAATHRVKSGDVARRMKASRKARDRAKAKGREL